MLKITTKRMTNLGIKQGILAVDRKKLTKFGTNIVVGLLINTGYSPT